MISERLKQERKSLTALARTRVLSDPLGYVSEQKMRLDLVQQRLLSVSQNVLGRQRQRFAMCAAKLDAMSPLKVLGRGYSVVKNQEGRLVRSVKQIQAGQNLNIQFEDGQAKALIQEVNHE